MVEKTRLAINFRLIFACSPTSSVEILINMKQMNSHENVARHLYRQKHRTALHSHAAANTFPLASNEQTKLPRVFHARGHSLVTQPCGRACIHTDLCNKVADRWELRGEKKGLMCEL